MKILNVKSGDYRHRCLNECCLSTFIHDDVPEIDLNGYHDFVDDISHGVDFVMESKTLPFSAYRIGPERMNECSDRVKNNFEHCCSFSSTGERVAYFHSNESLMPNVIFLEGTRMSVLFTKFLWKTCKSLQDHVRIKIGVAQDRLSNSSSTEFLKLFSRVSIVETTGNICQMKEALNNFSIGVYFTADGNGSINFQSALISELMQIENSLQNNTDLDALNALHCCRILLGLAKLFSLSPPTGDAVINALACEFMFCVDNMSLCDWNHIYHNQINYRFDWHPALYLPDELENCKGIKEINEIVEEAFNVNLGEENKEISDQFSIIQKTLLSGMSCCPLPIPIHGFSKSELESLDNLDAYVDPTTMFCPKKISISFDKLSRCWSPIFRFIHVQRFRNILKLLLDCLPTDAISRLVICPHGIEPSLITIYVEADSVQRAEKVAWCIILLMRAHVSISAYANEYLIREKFFRSESFETEFYDIDDYNTRKKGVTYIKCYDETEECGDLLLFNETENVDGEDGETSLEDVSKDKSTATERIVRNPLYIYNPLLHLENTVFAQPTLTLPTVLSPECQVSTVHSSACDSNVTAREFLRSLSLSKRQRFIDQRYLQLALRRVNLLRSRKNGALKFRNLRNVCDHIRKRASSQVSDNDVITTPSANVMVAHDVDTGVNPNFEAIPDHEQVPAGDLQMNGFASPEEKQFATEYDQMSPEQLHAYHFRQININGDLQTEFANYQHTIDGDDVSSNNVNAQEFVGTTTTSEQYQDEVTKMGSDIRSALYGHGFFNKANDLEAGVMTDPYPIRAGCTTDMYCKIMGKFPYFAIDPLKQTQNDDIAVNISPVANTSRNVGEWFPLPSYPHHSTLGYFDTSNGESVVDVEYSPSWEELGFTRVSNPDSIYTHFKIDDGIASLSNTEIGIREMVKSLPSYISDSDESTDQDKQPDTPSS